MIILRDKEFSTKLAKVIKSAKSTGNKVMTKIDNAGLAVGDTLMGKQSTFRFRPKSNTTINRETVALEKNIKSIPAKTKIAAQTPIGEIANKGISMAIENPIASTGQAASVIAPIINPSTAVIPFGSGSVALEKGIKNSWKGYDKVTKKGAEAYRRSRFSKAIGGNKTPSLLDFSRSLPI